jgi:hypothetical protein
VKDKESATPALLIIASAIAWSELAFANEGWSLRSVPGSYYSPGEHQTARQEYAYLKGKRFYLIDDRGPPSDQASRDLPSATRTCSTVAMPLFELHHLHAVEYEGKVYVAASGGTQLPTSITASTIRTHQHRLIRIHGLRAMTRSLPIGRD